MSAYAELVERCAKQYCIFLAEDDCKDAVKQIEAAWVRDNDDPARDAFCAMARRILAEVLRTLETEAEGTGNGTTGAIQFRADLLYWLRASPLSPP